MKKATCLAAALLSFALSAGAAEPAPRFAITGWTIEGNTLLDEATLQAALQPYARPDAGFETLKEAVAALERTYQEAGYSAVRVLLPEQDIDRGAVRLKVVEARLGRIFVEGNRHFGTDTVKASVPALREGAVPNIRTVSDELQVVNDGPARQQTVILKKGASPTEVDAVIRVIDASPLRVGLVADNSGSKTDGAYPTGRFRVGAVVQHANLFDLDHVASAQFMTSPDHASDVVIVGLGYRLPVYRTGGSVDLIAAYSDVDSGSIGTAGGNLNISGRGYTASARYNQYLPRQGEWLQKLFVGADYRMYRNTAADPASGLDFTPDLKETPVAAGYSISGRWTDIDLAATVSYQYGAPKDVESATPADYPHYGAWRYAFSLARPLFGNWQGKFEATGQYSREHLIAAEQFGLGGADSVRGFDERAVANDNGHRIGVSLTTPELGAHLGVDGLLLRALWFADAGQVRRVDPLPGETPSESISSSGLGLRGSLGRHLIFRADAGFIIEPGATQQSGDARLHASLIYLF